MLRRLGGFTISLWLWAAQAAPAADYSNPDSLEVAAAARAALAHAKTLDIVGVTLGIDAVLKDLGAKVTDRQIRIDLSADVLFDFDKYTLRAAANESLMKVGQVASGYPDAPLLIEGHTDGKGTHAYNMTLSDNRAGAVKKWLVENGGIKASRIATKGWGETKPVAPNKKPDGSDDPEGRQRNRRVELTPDYERLKRYRGASDTILGVLEIEANQIQSQRYALISGSSSWRPTSACPPAQTCPFEVRLFATRLDFRVWSQGS
jgi:photosystem I P700 chlorophyll a apoprotein A2